MRDLSDWLGLLRHSNPLLRILHIAEGKGVVSPQVLEHLNSETLPFYSKYTYTSTKDISSAVHERLKEFKSVDFKNLDITTDPCQQGFEKGAYDLVIVSNVCRVYFRSIRHSGLLTSFPAKRSDSSAANCSSKY
jgi:hypothetical protein